MKLTLSEPRLLKESISIISELVTDARFKIDKDKIELVAMDPANVAMVIFKLLSSAFVEYKVDKPIELGINLSNLNQVLKRAKPTDILTLELDHDRNKLKIQLKGESNKTFHLALLDADNREQKIPDLKFPLKIMTSSRLLDEAIEDVGVVAESVSLIADIEKLSIKSEGNMSEARIEVSAGKDTTIDMLSKEAVAARYSIDYLKKIIKGAKLSDKVSMQFNKDYPLKVEYTLLDKLSFAVILAPRYSND